LPICRQVKSQPPPGLAGAMHYVAMAAVAPKLSAAPATSAFMKCVLIVSSQFIAGIAPQLSFWTYARKYQLTSFVKQAVIVWQIF